MYNVHVPNVLNHADGSCWKGVTRINKQCIDTCTCGSLMNVVDVKCKMLLKSNLSPS